jgi:hypothetical protein
MLLIKNSNAANFFQIKLYVMNTLKKSVPYELRDDLNAMWANERNAILKTVGIVTAVAVVATAFFLGRHKLMNALMNTKLYQSGVDLTNKIADTAGAVSHKVADTACAVTGKVMDSANAVSNYFNESSAVSKLN